MALVLVRFGALAVMVADPVATLVTDTDTLVVPTPKLTIAGAVATVASLEFRLMTNAADAGADRFSVRFCVVIPLIVRLPGTKLMVMAGVTPPVTCTWARAVG